LEIWLQIKTNERHFTHQKITEGNRSVEKSVLASVASELLINQAPPLAISRNVELARAGPQYLFCLSRRFRLVRDFRQSMLTSASLLSP